MAVDRFHPPVVNDEAPHPEYVDMHEHRFGGFVRHEDYECLQSNQALLRDHAQRMMVAVRNSCADVVIAKMVEADNPQVAEAFKALEEELRNMKVEFALLAPREER